MSMINLAYTTLVDYNKTGIDNMLTYVASNVPIFVPLVLFTVFIMVLLSTYFGTKRFQGQSDFFASMATASTLTVIIATMMTLKDGLIDSYTLAVTITVFVISVVLLFFNKEK